MDLSNSKNSSSKRDNCNVEEKHFNKAVLCRKTFYSSFRPQSFPFRNSLIHYITMNPSTPKVYRKLIQSCKHFFIKNPILIAPKLCFDVQDRRYYYCSGRFFYFYNITSKIWITRSIFSENQHVLSILSKIYKNDAFVLALEKISISYNDFVSISLNARNCEMLILSDVTVTEEDGSIIPVETIVKAFPKLKVFNFDLCKTAPKVYTSKSAEALIKLLSSSNFTEFALSGITENYDIEKFYVFIKKNKKTDIHLSFSDQISEGYKNRLQTIVDEIYGAENHDYIVPWIRFKGRRREFFWK